MALRRSFWGVLALLAISVLVAYFTPLISGVPTPVFFTRLVYLSALLIVIGYLWAYFSTRGLALFREARVLRHQVGQVFEERFKLLNRLPFLRLWVEIRDESPLPGNSGSRVLSLIGPKQQRSYIAYTMLNRRGSFRLGPTQLISGDPFGLFTFTRVHTAENTLVVLPYIVTLNNFPSPSGMFPGGRAIRRRSAETTPQAAGVRDYAPGDSLRRIHWPTSVRRDRLMSKEFEEDPQADVWIFLDAFAPVHFTMGNGSNVGGKIDPLWMWQRQTEVKLPPDSFEYAVSAAGSIANYYIRAGRTVGFISAGQILTVLSPERGERQLNKILETLTFLNPDGDLPLTAVIEAQAPSLPRASTVVLITPSTDEALELGLDYLILRNLRPVIVFLDARSFGGNLGGEEIVYRFKQRGVPLMVVDREKDLTESLETPYE